MRAAWVAGSLKSGAMTFGVDEICIWIWFTQDSTQQYSAIEYSIAKADVRRVFALARDEAPASFAIRLILLCSFAALRDSLTDVPCMKGTGLK